LRRAAAQTPQRQKVLLGEDTHQHLADENHKEEVFKVHRVATTKAVYESLRFPFPKTIKFLYEIAMHINKRYNEKRPLENVFKGTWIL